MRSNIVVTSDFIKNATKNGKWTDWRWQISHIVRNVEQFREYFSLSEDVLASSHFVREIRNGSYDAMRLTPYLLSLIDFQNPRDPIALQHFPQLAETHREVFTSRDLWEQEEDFVDGNNRMVQQKYPDIVVLRLSNTCHSFCRFCFEKERTLRRKVLTSVADAAFNKALTFIASQKNVRQVLVSGGDPLVMTDEFLAPKLEQILSIPQVVTLRINTRSFLHNPFRITSDFASLLGS